jgi:hypothetical protein
MDSDWEFRLSTSSRNRISVCLPSQALANTCGNFLEGYGWGPEAKSNGPKGEPYDARTQGLLSRVPVIASSFGYIGKQSDRRWEQGEDISLLKSQVVEYRPNETVRLSTDLSLRFDIGPVSIRQLAREANVSETSVKSALRSERKRKATLAKLRKALNSIVGSR